MKLDIGRLLGLRPKGDGAAELRAAREGALATRAAAEASVAVLEAGRGEALLDGRPDAAAEHERRLAEARLEAERAAAIAAALEPRIRAAEGREALAELRRLRAGAEERSAEVARWLRTDYPPLAAQLAEGLLRERRAVAAVAAAEAAMAKLGNRLAAEGSELAAEDAAPIVPPAQRLWPDWPLVAEFAREVRLPSVDSGPPRPWGSATPIWPAPVERP